MLHAPVLDAEWNLVMANAGVGRLLDVKIASFRIEHLFAADAATALALREG